MGPRGNPVASRLMKDADVIIALGTRLGFNSTFFSYENLNKKAKRVILKKQFKLSVLLRSLLLLPAGELNIQEIIKK